MTERPWQPGPWQIADHGVVDANGKHVHRDPSGANVALEVLAPQMAEVILRLAKSFESGDDIRDLYALALELRRL